MLVRKLCLIFAFSRNPNLLNMTRITIIFYLFLTGFAAYAQVDSALLKQLTKPIVRCEEVAVNSQRMLTKLYPEQMDSINLIINAWAEYCGKTEPIYRIQVLRALQEGQPADTLFARYLIEYQFQYQNRIQSSEVGSADYYQHYRDLYSHVPFHGEFDKWTSRWAASMLHDQVTNSSSHWMALFLSNQFEAFRALKDSKNNRKHPFNDLLWELQYKNTRSFDYSILFGSWIPSGKLAQGFTTSPMMGLGMGGKLGENGRLDIMFNMAFFHNDAPITLDIKNVSTQTSANSLINFSLIYGREFALGKKVYFDALGGLGVSNMTTDLEKPQKSSDDPGNYSATAIDISWGGALRVLLGRKHDLGITGRYHFAPFNDSRILVNDIGNQFVTVAVFFRPRIY